MMRATWVDMVKVLQVGFGKTGGDRGRLSGKLGFMAGDATNAGLGAMPPTVSHGAMRRTYILRVCLHIFGASQLHRT